MRGQSVNAFEGRVMSNVEVYLQTEVGFVFAENRSMVGEEWSLRISPVKGHIGVDFPRFIQVTTGRLAEFVFLARFGGGRCIMVGIETENA